MFGFDVTNQDLALIGQFSENKFNGVNCGIMDQFAIAMGKAGHAIFLDTATLKYEYAPIKLENAKIVISCSNKNVDLEIPNTMREEVSARLHWQNSRKLLKLIPLVNSRRNSLNSTKMRSKILSG